MPTTTKKFYRVCNPTSEQGLWYNIDGTPSNLIHTKFTFCENSQLRMDFDMSLMGWLSVTDTLEGLYKWFPEKDIQLLKPHGWVVCEYEAHDFKFYDRFQHYVINQGTSKLIRVLSVNE